MLSRLTLVAFFNKFSIRVAYAYIQKAKTIADFAFLPPNNLRKKCVNPQDKIICSFLETGETSFLDVWVYAVLLDRVSLQYFRTSLFLLQDVDSNHDLTHKWCTGALFGIKRSKWRKKTALNVAQRFLEHLTAKVNVFFIANFSLMTQVSNCSSV